MIPNPAIAAPSSSSFVGGDKRPFRLDPHALPAALEFPIGDGAAREPVADAGMVDEVARVGGRAVGGEIGRRRRGDIMLDPGPDRNRDHVALDPLLVADAGVEAGPDHVDECVVGGDLEHDPRIEP